jgi:shikimate dehydrogenase
MLPGQTCSFLEPWFMMADMSSPAVQPLLALIASEVGGNPTQYTFEQAFAHHDLDWRYLSFDVNAESLHAAIGGLRALGFRGGHCADPYKQAVIPWLDRTTETATMVGSVNLIFREEDALVGDNIEGKAVVQAIRNAANPAGKRIVLLGAGQVARAVAVELAAAGVAHLLIVNRTPDRAAELAAMVAAKFPVPAAAVPWEADYVVAPEADILIHATSLGHGDDESRPPVSLDSLRPELVVADVAADSPHSWLLDQAAQRGCKTVDGLSMFIEQAAMSFQLWTGVDPDRQVLREAVEEFLEL